MNDDARARHWRANNTEKVNNYYQSKKDKILNRMKRYWLRSGKDRNKQTRLARLQNLEEKRAIGRIKRLRLLQRYLALLNLENEGIKAYNGNLGFEFPTYSLSYLLKKQQDL